MLLLLALLVGSLSCECPDDTSLMKVFDNSAAVYYATVREDQVSTVELSIKGCLATGQKVKLSFDDASCAIQFRPMETYLITVKTISNGAGAKSAQVSACHWIKPQSELHDTDLYLVASQPDMCPDLRCQGSDVLQCEANICGPKPKWSKVCSQAASCETNACTCQPIFKDQTGQRVCTGFDGDQCPSGNSNLPCPMATCSGPPPCPEATHCVVDSCGGCNALWLDQYGREVCQAVAPSSAALCRDIVNLHPDTFDQSCPKKSLGFAVKDGACEKITGCSAGSIALHSEAKMCEEMCFCPDLSKIKFGTCGSNLGYGLVDGSCQPIRGCPKFKSAALGLHITKDGCESACGFEQATPAGKGKGKGKGAPAPAGKGKGASAGKGGKGKGGKGKGGKGKGKGKGAPSPPQPAGGKGKGKGNVDVVDVVPLDTTPPKTITTQVDGSCPPAKPKFSCRSDPCDFARPPRCREARDKRLVCVADYCGGCFARWFYQESLFECPPEPRCNSGDDGCCPSGLLPVDCSGQECPADLCVGATRCELDPCEYCKVHFFDSSDTEIPLRQCRTGTAPERAVAPATNVPTRTPCTGGLPACCADNFKPLECPLQIRTEICPRVECGSHEIATCRPDGCDYCNIRIIDTKGEQVDVLAQCSLPSPEPECPDVVCPDIEPTCGTRPWQCPEDMNLKCVLDPCVCISVWIEEESGSPPRCVQNYSPPCIPADKCPQEFSCPPPPPELYIPEAVMSQLACIQEPCTCRPIVVLEACVKSEDCPPITAESCGEIHPATAAWYTPEQLALFKCEHEECTCREVWVPPADAVPLLVSRTQT